MNKIHYKAGYKYQLTRCFLIQADIMPPNPVKDDYLTLQITGMLTISTGYASDGSSGPAEDTPESMRAAFAHDALYELMRKGKLAGSWRSKADKLYRDLCVVDGMWRVRAWWRYRALVRLGRSSTLAKNAREEISAP